MKLVDIYYNRPILYDYILSLTVIGIYIICECYGFCQLSDPEKYIKIATDIGRTGLIVSGFILTMVTILLSLKSNQIIIDKKLKNDSSAFLIFLASPMFRKSINILKYGILSLVFISITLYVFSLISPKNYFNLIFYLDLVGLIIILLTFLRCFYVLNLILKTQSSSKNRSSQDN